MEEGQHPPDDRNESGLLAQGLRYASVATQFCITLLVIGYLGYRLDESRGWSPWGVLTGICVGMMLGVWIMLRELAKLDDKQD